MMRSVLLVLLGIVLLPLAALLAGAAGLLPVRATATPPAWEEGLADLPLHAGLRRAARGLRNPIAPNDAAALARGRMLFGQNCAGCHGSAKGPSLWGARNLYPRVPQFFQGAEMEMTPELTFVAIRDGIRYSGMGAWRGMMSERDMWLVANFVTRIPATPAAAHPTNATE